MPEGINLPAIITRISVDLAPGIPGHADFDICMEKSAALIFDHLEIPIAFEDIELSLVITSDSEIREMNRTHRDLDRPTDVLSFPLLELHEIKATTGTDGQKVILGDVVISLETIKRQSVERDQDIVSRFSECLVHGILHLLGLDHEKIEERIRMEQLEDYLVPEIYDILMRATKS